MQLLNFNLDLNSIAEECVCHDLLVVLVVYLFIQKVKDLMHRRIVCIRQLIAVRITLMSSQTWSMAYYG